MRFDDDKPQDSSGTPPDDKAASWHPDMGSADDPETETATSPDGASTPPQPPQQTQPSPWQPLPTPTHWGAAPGQPNQWDPGRPSTPPAWQAGPGWQPQSGWQSQQPQPVWPPQPQPGGQPQSGWQPQGWPLAPTQGFEGRDFPPPSTAGAPRRPSRLPQILVVVAACLLAFSGGLVTDHVGFANNSGAQGPGGAPNPSISGANLYNEALSIVKQNFVGRSSVTDQQLLYGSIRGMVDALGDTGHSEFLTPQEYAALQSSLSASVAGIGVVMSTDSAGVFKVDRVIPGAPAAAAGVKAGDLITAVDGVSTSTMTFDQLGSKVRGLAGTQVTITVIHLGTTNPLDITMTRADVTVPLATWGMVPGTHVADIALSEFSTGAADQLQTDLTAATSAGATSIILDLRGNPGGYATEAQDVASEFLSSGVVYIQQDAKGNNTSIDVNTGRTHTNVPLVVLVDHDSASSSEIVAGALQDHGRAKIVGVNTFGTGTVLEPFQLSDGSVIILGTAWWLTPNGHRIFSVGIKPDQTVQMTGTTLPIDPTALAAMSASQLAASGDAQLLAAVQDLTS